MNRNENSRFKRMSAPIVRDEVSSVETVEWSNSAS